MKNKKLKVHKIKLINKEPGTLSKGTNTKILLDGKELKGCKSVKYEVDAHGVGVLKLEMYGDFTIAQEIGKYSKTVVGAT